jgi:DNA-binding NtrC family response regulator
MSSSPRILIVEDEFAVAMELQDRLERLGYTVVGHELSGDDAIARATATRPDLVLMDVRLDGRMDGIEAARAIRAIHPVPVVFVTAYSDDETVQRAAETAPFGYVVKPIEERELYAALEVARSTHALQQRIERANDDLRRLLNSLRQGTLLIGADATVAFVSDPAATLLGVSPSRITGRPWDTALPVSEAVVEALRAHMHQGDTAPVFATIAPESPLARRLEIEVRPDPRDDSRHVLVLYDVTTEHDLREMLDQRDRFHGMIGQSAPMQAVFQQLQAVAAVDATVLIQGETGTGKELAARAIHAESARADGPFVAVNCGALNPDLAGSLLFGHRRGAFTGATDDREGFFEAADGGTLFLDEIGDVPLDVQRQLLRVLEERAVTRLGATEARPVDVRIVAATHRALDREVEAGRFRNDLLYRIRVARVTLPPLRERRSDLPLLVRTFVRVANARMGTGVTTIGDDAMRQMVDYPWPGNVRELRNAVASALIQATGATLHARDLPPELSGTSLSFLDAAPDAPPDAAERIRAALQQTDGNRSAAADLLGISRSTLYRRLDEYGIG